MIHGNISMKRKTKNSILILVLFISSTAFSQVSRTIDSLMTIPLIQGTYAFNLPGGDLKDRFGFNHEIGAGFHIKTKKGWLFGVEGGLIFGNQVKGDTANIEPIRDEQNRILGSTEGNAYFTDYDILQRGLKLPVFKFGKLFHKNWLKGSKNSGPFITAGIGYWQYKLKIHDVDNSIQQLKEDYGKGYDHLTGGLMTTQSVGYLYLDKHKLLNISLSFEFSQGYTKNLRSWNMSTLGPINEDRLDLNYGLKLSWYFPIYPKLATGYYYY